MKLVELWNVTDGVPLFLSVDEKFVEVLDGPGYPVVNGSDVSDLIVQWILPTTYPTYGSVLEIKAL